MNELDKSLKCLLCPIEEYKKCHKNFFERIFQLRDDFYSPDGLAVSSMEFQALSSNDNPAFEAAALHISEESRHIALYFEKLERLAALLDKPDICEQFCDGTSIDTSSKYLERRCNSELLDPEIGGIIVMPISNDGH